MCILPMNNLSVTWYRQLFRQLEKYKNGIASFFPTLNTDISGFTLSPENLTPAHCFHTYKHCQPTAVHIVNQTDIGVHLSWFVYTHTYTHTHTFTNRIKRHTIMLKALNPNGLHRNASGNHFHLIGVRQHHR